MTDFDPNDELDTQEQADAYVVWCAEQFMRLLESPKRTYRTGIRCAQWLFVISSAQLHLDEDVTENVGAMLEQLGMYSKLGRALERQRQHYPIERLIVLRSSLDCWEPVGEWSSNLLFAAKCAVSAMTLVGLHPLIDLWELRCPDVWALLDGGANALAAINDGKGPLTFADYAVRPNEATIAKFTWQKVNNLTRQMGMPPLSPN